MLSLLTSSCCLGVRIDGFRQLRIVSLIDATGVDPHSRLPQSRSTHGIRSHTVWFRRSGIQEPCERNLRKPKWFGTKETAYIRIEHIYSRMQSHDGASCRRQPKLWDPNHPKRLPSALQNSHDDPASNADWKDKDEKHSYRALCPLELHCTSSWRSTSDLKSSKAAGAFKREHDDSTHNP